MIQLTETVALTDFTAVVSVLIAAVVAATSYVNNERSRRQVLNTFTMRFLEMENADVQLHQARAWLETASFDAGCDLALYADIEHFFAAKGQGGDLAVKRDGTGKVVQYSVADNAAAAELLKAFLTGKTHIAKIAESRGIAADALQSGVLAEPPYKLVHREAFIHDYQRLQGYIGIKMAQGGGSALRDFAAVAEKWAAEPAQPSNQPAANVESKS